MEPLDPSARVIHSWRERIEKGDCGLTVPLRGTLKGQVTFDSLVRAAYRNSSYGPFVQAMERNGQIMRYREGLEIRVRLIKNSADESGGPNAPIDDTACAFYDECQEEIAAHEAARAR